MFWRFFGFETDRPAWAVCDTFLACRGYGLIPLFRGFTWKTPNPAQLSAPGASKSLASKRRPRPLSFTVDVGDLDTS